MTFWGYHIHITFLTVYCYHCLFIISYYYCLLLCPIYKLTFSKPCINVVQSICGFRHPLGSGNVTPVDNGGPLCTVGRHTRSSQECLHLQIMSFSCISVLPGGKETELPLQSQVGLSVFVWDDLVKKSPRPTLFHHCCQFSVSLAGDTWSDDK